MPRIDRDDELFIVVRRPAGRRASLAGHSAFLLSLPVPSRPVLFLALGGTPARRLELESFDRLKISV